ncbi:MAG TPA: VWA domain-containing protein [Candidatus Binatia bacterium]|nr:VWA domain-containing protein [Candidatus Binatia bacterium]
MFCQSMWDGRRRFLKFACAALALACSFWILPAFAQNQSSTPPQDNSQNNGKPRQEAPADGGGPDGSMSPYAIPRKNPEEAPPPPPPPAAAPKVEGLPDYSIKVSVPLVNVDVMVNLKTNGQFVPGLKKDNFKIFEDGNPQQITDFTITKAPITAVLLVEFGDTNYVFMVDALRGSYSFVNSLKKDDWVAVTYFDMRPHILIDFTQDKNALFGALNTLRMPGFSEANVFDALYDTLDRLDRIEGKKYVILVTAGVDTFSRITLDKVMKKVKDTKDVTIFPISIGFAYRNWCEARLGNGCPGAYGMGRRVDRMDFAQADNQMRTFASMTGGRAYFPRFEAEFPEIFGDISSDIRNQYSLAYHPTNSKLDGTYRKLKVEVVAPDGGPLKVKDQKGKDQKIEVVSRDGYTAKHTVD